ncbi:hypothetical protein CVT24_001028 [Panaeolus cyanescens]|uniref:UDENN domain-containing protein n=1 Tax=Panaeolus cyanescens TaxID=181874 RepID=A0A409YTG7_9AGAR|nr:hypothetical protein CVT24_001028 [Panaeolus cyanescens]
MSTTLLPPSPTTPSRALPRESDDDDDGDTASQRSISLSSPPLSPRDSFSSDPRHSFATQSSQTSVSHRESKGFDEYEDQDDIGTNSSRGYVESTDIPVGVGVAASAGLAAAVAAVAVNEQRDSRDLKPVTYPPTPPNRDDTMSISSFASTSSRKARPESLLITPSSDPIVLGVALVDFNHLVGPRIEFSKGDIFDDEEVAKILPFLALPDGAHLSKEDYSYFHLVKPGPSPTTIFGISCNQQIAASSLLVKAPDVTRSTVQKAVVVLAAKPVFGPIREKLRVVTTALFLQRDFTDNSILDDFAASLEPSLRGQLTESGLYMGTSIREFVHTFRQKTLILVKALMLQKRIMFYGYPVEKLCTYQYSLVSLLPGLLQTLDDCGSPPLASRAPTLSKPTSLRTSDHKSMMAFMGLPLDIFGKDSLFQPYLPLQQLDMLKATPSWLCGCTNSIITQQNEIELLVNMDTGVFEFRDPRLERVVGLTPADRKWMDDVVNDVNETWDVEDMGSGMHTFKGSDDYLRSKFEEYISAALSTVKYQDFTAKGEGGGVIITGGTGGSATSVEDFNPVWIAEFKKTNAYAVWERITDPLLFDIVEPRHPCTERPSVVADIGLRLQEGIQELKLEQQLAPAREAVARTFTVGSTSFFKAVENVKGRWGRSVSSSGSGSAAESNSASPSGNGNGTGLKGQSPAPSIRSINDDANSAVEVSKADYDGTWDNGLKTAVPNQSSMTGTTMTGTSYTPYFPKPRLRPFSLTSNNSLPSDSPVNSPSPREGDALTGGHAKSQQEQEQQTAKPSFSSWSAGIGSFLSAKTGRFSMARAPASAGVGSSAQVGSMQTVSEHGSVGSSGGGGGAGSERGSVGSVKPLPTAPVGGRFSSSSLSSRTSERSSVARKAEYSAFPESPDLEREMYSRVDVGSPISPDSAGSGGGEKLGYSPTVGEAVGSPLFNGVTPGTSPTDGSYSGMGSIAGILAAAGVEKDGAEKAAERQVEQKGKVEEKVEVEKSKNGEENKGVVPEKKVEEKKEESLKVDEKVKDEKDSNVAVSQKPNVKRDDDDDEEEELSASEMAAQAYAM